MKREGREKTTGERGSGGRDGSNTAKHDDRNDEPRILKLVALGQNEAKLLSYSAANERAALILKRRDRTMPPYNARPDISLRGNIQMESRHYRPRI